MTLSLYDDPELYDLVSGAPESEPFYRRLADTHPGAVLELACGTGRIGIRLAQAGLDVTGIDLSAEMLARATATAEAAGVRVRFAQGDMRALDLGAGRFSLIFITANSLLHLLSPEDFRACFEGVRRHLAPDGVFAFDIFAPAADHIARDPRRRFDVAAADHPELGRIRVEETTDYDAASQITRTTWYWSTERAPDFRVTRFELRSVFPQELPALLEAGGLTLESRSGDFDGAAFNENSWRQVCVCRPT